MASHSSTLPSSGNPSFLYLLLVTAILSTVLVLALGSWVLVTLPLVFLVQKLVPNLHITFLLFLCFLPALGEFDKDPILPNIWFPSYALLMVSWLYHVATNPKRIYFNGPLTVASFVFLLVCMLSLLGSYDLGPEAADQPLLNSPYRYVWEPALICTLGILSMSAFETERQLEAIFWVVILSGLFYGFTIFFTGFEMEEGGRIGRQSGLFNDAGPAATYMLFCVILSTSLLRYTWGKKHALLLLASLFFLFTQIFTIAKTVMVAMGIIFLLSTLLNQGLKRTLGYCGLLIMGGILLFPLLPTSLQTPILQIFVSLFVDPTMPVGGQGGDISTYSERVEHWKMGFDLLTTDLSLLGLGFGKHMLATRPPVQIHVYYITILAEVGLIGLSTFLAIISITLFIAFRSLRYFRCIKHEQMVSLVKGLILSFISILIIYTATPGLQEGQRIFWVLVGLIGAVDRIRKSTQLQTRATSESFPS